ncbi:MAG: hypothetical protein HN472_03750 [Nitrospina sp.]|jgi:hypothetical protein|nr:hypothetical protein [Nitrospina sp.]MBT3875666.1 hypothetical protein [Nitrospina sp.]MBT4048497.1 hypothetical protein [Nitrospina sp.]MBT4558907.1 hypothetical protein [Nitrospina sp.]MBT5348212.1 hypothetical protein [Nitrospina sp.]
MKSLITFTRVIGILFILSSPGRAGPVPEPPLESQVGWALAHSGMLYVGYDLDFNGKPDFFTLRVVTLSFFSKDSIQQTARNHPHHPVFCVPYNSSSYYYVTESQPLFYAFDNDEDGHWDIMYKDVLTDGVNGNEEYYDSPSGRRPLNLSNKPKEKHHGFSG